MKKQTSVFITILAISLAQMGANAIAPILSSLMAAFPGTAVSTVQYLMTFPSLFVIVSSLLTGRVSQYIAKKYLAMLGCALCIASGLGSFFCCSSLVLLYVFAGVFGIGVGIEAALATSMVADFFTGGTRTTLMGLQSSAANVGCMLMTFAGGLLAMVHWRCNYLVYLIMVPGLVLSAFLPARKAEKKKGTRVRLSGTVLLGCLLAILTTMLFNLIPTNVSLFLTEKGLGTSATAGTATTLLMLSGTLFGIAFGKIASFLRRYTLVLGLGLLTAGLLVCAAAQTIALLLAGCVLAGATMALVMPQIMLECTSSGTGAEIAAASAAVMAASNLGGFLTPVLTSLAALFGGSGCAARFVTGAVIAVPVLIWQLVLSVKGQRRA